jgi:hypothetical protein
MLNPWAAAAPRSSRQRPQAWARAGGTERTALRGARAGARRSLPLANDPSRAPAPGTSILDLCPPTPAPRPPRPRLMSSGACSPRGRRSAPLPGSGSTSAHPVLGWSCSQQSDSTMATFSTRMRSPGNVDAMSVGTPPTSWTTCRLWKLPLPPLEVTRTTAAEGTPLSFSKAMSWVSERPLYEAEPGAAYARSAPWTSSKGPESTISVKTACCPARHCCGRRRTPL